MSEAGSLLYLYVLIKTFVTIDLFLIFVLTQLKSYRVKLKSNYLNLIAVALYFFMLGGTADVPLGVVVLGLLTVGKTFRWVLNSEKNDQNKELNSITRNILILMIALPAVIIILFLGESIKVGFSLADTNIAAFFSSYGGLQSFFYYLIESFSSALHSINYSLERAEIYPLENHLMPVLDSLLFRISSILNVFGTDIILEKQEVSSMSQFNFLMLTDRWSDIRQGTSAGVFASFIYLCGIPLGLIFSSMYLVLVARIIDWFLMFHIDNRKYTLIGLLVVSIFMSVFFQSPIDLLNILDNASILILLIIIFAGFSKNVVIRVNSRKQIIISN
ncbi:hypothetical protein OAK90_00275 [bacterium]|nr:hypothetical protein [bacterium]